MQGVFANIAFPTTAVFRVYVAQAILFLVSFAALTSFFGPSIDFLLITLGVSGLLLCFGIVMRISLEEARGGDSFLPIALAGACLMLTPFLGLEITAWHRSTLLLALIIPITRLCSNRRISLLFASYFSLLGLLNIEFASLSESFSAIALPSHITLLGGLLLVFAYRLPHAQRMSRSILPSEEENIGRRTELDQVLSITSRSEHEFRELFRAARQILHREFLSDYLHRLIPLTLVLTGCTMLFCLQAVEQIRSDASFFQVWSVCLLGLLASLARLFRRGDFRRIYFYAFCSVVFAVFPIIHLLLIFGQPSFFALGVLFVFAMFAGILPFPRGYGVLLHLFFAFLIAAYASSFLWPAALLAFVLAFIVVRASLLEYVQTLSRALFLVFSRALTTIDSVTLLRFLSWSARKIFLQAESILVTEHGAALRVGEFGEAQNHDGITAPGFSHWLSHLEKDGGIVSSREIPPEVKPELRMLLRPLPSRFAFIRLEAVLNSRNTELFLVVSLRVSSAFIGPSRLFRVLYGITKLTQSKLLASQTQFRSSDLLSSLQRRLSEREKDFGEVVHQSNNFSQEALLTFEGISADELTNHQKESVEFLFDLSQASARFATDIKVLRDFERLGRLESFEWVASHFLEDDLERSGRFLARRKGISFSYESTLPTDGEFQVVSFDFLSSALRLFAFEVTKRLRENGRFRIEVFSPNEVTLHVRLEDSLIGWSLHDESSVASTVVRSSTGRDIDLESTFRKLALLSRGSFGISEPSEGYVNSYFLELPFRVGASPQRGRRGRSSKIWGMFVDDNPKVLTFYSHIGKALEVPFETCASLSEARAVLDERGEPGFLVTDYELGDGYGVELLQEIERRNFHSVKKVMVSGNKEIDLGTVRDVRVLSKPISRKKLFNELKVLIELL